MIKLKVTKQHKTYCLAFRLPFKLQISGCYDGKAGLFGYIPWAVQVGSKVFFINLSSVLRKGNSNEN